MRSARALALLFLCASTLGMGGCVEALPEKIALKAEAADVEVIHETPNLDVYESAGDVSATVIGREVDQAFKQAFNSLRNQAAAKGATFVAVNDVSARSSWDMSGRMIVSIVATAYKPK